MNLEKFNSKLPKPKINASKATALNKIDLQELCDATEEAIVADGGFGWVNPPVKKNRFYTNERATPLAQYHLQQIEDDFH